jgi:predicted DNA-binding transcriptional regulator YafY
METMTSTVGGGHQARKLRKRSYDNYAYELQRVMPKAAAAASDSRVLAGGLGQVPAVHQDFLPVADHRDPVRAHHRRSHEDLGLGNAARSAILKVMRAVPAPFRPAATATSQRILVDPERWMRAQDPVGHLGVLQAVVFSERRLRLRYRSGGSRGAGELAERVVDPYGLVCKSGIWYLVADQDGEPRLFRVSRVVSAEADEAPVRRRDGVEFAELWQALRRQVEERPTPLGVTARVRRDWLGVFRRICATHLVDGEDDDGGDDPEWAVVRLRFGGVAAARILLSFGGDAEVMSPPEVRDDLAAVAAATVELYHRTRV